MIVEQQDLLSFLGNGDASFSIPAYQRLYSWNAAQCEELLRDILRAERTDRNHFLGTVLYVRERVGGAAAPTENAVPSGAPAAPDAAAASDAAATVLGTPAAGTGPERWSVIDGQQRLTSVSLVLLALARFASSHPDAGIDGAALRTRYLEAGSPDRPRFMPSPHDAKPYLAALAGEPADPASAVGRNLALFEDALAADGFDPHVLLQGLKRLGIIAVEVEDPASAQSIFEGINSKGMPLNVADMVRNYLLLAETHDEQTRLYEEYWRPSQDMFSPDPGSLKLNAGIKSWISVRLKGARILSPEQVYGSFKTYVEDVYQGDKEPILQELRGFCLMWAESYRYHGVKKYRSGSDWARIGAPTLTAGYELKKAHDEAYAERVREQLKNTDARW